MQLVSRKQLFNLTKNTGLNETEDFNFDYSAFLQAYNDVNEEVKKLYSSYTGKDKEDFFKYKAYMHITTWLRKNIGKHIRYVGKGSSRAAFALTGGKCIKIAFNNAGIAQNKQEVKIFETSEREGLMCFTQIYEYDLSYSLLLTECCSKATEDNIQKYLGLPLEFIVHALNVLEDNKFYNIQYKNIIDLINDTIKNDDHYPEMLKFWKNCLNNKKPQWDIMRDLLTFYTIDSNNLNELLIGDLEQIGNWGLAIRSGKKVPIILDYGFSQDVANNPLYQLKQ